MERGGTAIEGQVGMRRAGDRNAKDHTKRQANITF